MPVAAVVRGILLVVMQSPLAAYLGGLVYLKEVLSVVVFPTTVDCVFWFECLIASYIPRVRPGQWPNYIQQSLINC